MQPDKNKTEVQAPLDDNKTPLGLLLKKNVRLIVDIWGLNKTPLQLNTLFKHYQKTQLIKNPLNKEKTKPDTDYEAEVTKWEESLNEWKTGKATNLIVGDISDDVFRKNLIKHAPVQNKKSVPDSPEKSKLESIDMSNLPMKAQYIIRQILSSPMGLKTEWNDTRRKNASDNAGSARSYHQNENRVLKEYTKEEREDALKGEGAGKSIRTTWHTLFENDCENLQNKQKQKGIEVNESGYYEVNIDGKGGTHVQSRLIFDYLEFHFYYIPAHTYNAPMRVELPEENRKLWLAQAAKQKATEWDDIKEGTKPESEAVACGEITPQFNQNGNTYHRYYTLGDGHCLYRSVLAQEPYSASPGQGVLMEPLFHALEGSIIDLRLQVLIEMLNMRSEYLAGGGENAALLVTEADILNAMFFGWGGDAELRAMARIFPNISFEVTPMWDIDNPIVYNAGVVNIVRLYYTGSHYEAVS